MPKPTPVEDLIIPPQDQKICGTICVCQMTAVLSAVAIVYLTVAIYMPYSRAISSGIDPVPIMCTTTRAVNKDNCDWGSCGEWCLSKTSGACIQIYVNVRKNGSSLLLAECGSAANKTCYGIDQENAKKYHCIRDECRNLTGTFNCTEGKCINITDAFECAFRETDPPLKCSGRRGKITCIDVHGLFSCNRGTCRKIRTPYNCDRRCVDIPTRNKNVIVLSGDRVFLARCSKLAQEDGGSVVWTDSGEEVLMLSCHAVHNGTSGVVAIDCINAALLPRTEISDLTNFTYLQYLYTIRAVPNRLIAPSEVELTIANDSRLMINLEGCVNTLADECKEFLKDYGRDGTDHNAKARFPCFYTENDAETVVARFDLDATYRQFIVALILPTVLVCVSCVTLVLCQKTIEVGDDAKMRFKKFKNGGGQAEMQMSPNDPVSPL
ncbi:uncharacterized protein LOC131842352 isoform X1 [Achroia grisella]|uniref:uncharacterized protein LOC131842352 isoform X1 n=1 Tax=Achroia grisella TaxID=688607 RepID=UPI0027D33311|nr:uncharacterized protein LOC131842352 isoform X1 [Achroia grisella]